MILTLLAIITIGGADRSLVNLKLTNNLKFREQSFLLAEAALQSTFFSIQKNPALLRHTSGALLEYSDPETAYSVVSIYQEKTGSCKQSLQGTTEHFELLAVARAGHYAMAQHAIGLTVCEYRITDFSGKPTEAQIYSDADRIYWRTVTQEEVATIMEQREAAPTPSTSRDR
jgi:hypothetical protein